MIDIISAEDGKDLGVFDTQTPRAANILSVQLESLEYAPDLGIDLAYFLSEDFRFQNQSFRSYCVEILANNGVNVATVTNTVEDLLHRLSFELNAEDTSDSLVAR